MPHVRTFWQLHADWLALDYIGTNREAVLVSKRHQNHLFRSETCLRPVGTDSRRSGAWCPQRQFSTIRTAFPSCRPAGRCVAWRVGILAGTIRNRYRSIHRSEKRR